MIKKIVITLVVLIVLTGIVQAVRARGEADRVEALAQPFFVPVVMTPSIQLVTGQVILFKATNLSEDSPVNFRLMLFKDDSDGVPTIYKDFTKVAPAATVTYVYEPKTAPLTLGAATVEAPEAVRATFAPVPGDVTPNAIRRILANVQLMRIQSGPGGTATMVEPPIVVPLSHCRFEPRGFVPYTGARWYWNCAPTMEPVDRAYRSANRTERESGTRPY